MLNQSPSLDDVLAHLEASIADAHLSDGERRELVLLLRESKTPEEGLRRVRNKGFDLVRMRLGTAELMPLLKWLEGVVRALDTVRAPAIVSKAYFSPGDACLNAILQHLRRAQRTIDICVFTLSDDRIADEVLMAHRRGVSMRLITDNDKEYDAGSDIYVLRKAGIAVAVDRTAAHMHHKFALFDNLWLLNGSYNWTRSACQINEENLVVTNDPVLIQEFAEQFSMLWDALANK